MKTYSRLRCLAPLLAVVSTPAGAHTTDCAGPVVCPAICAPTCGSDGRTYSSPCALAWQTCKNPSLTDVAGGVCPGDTAWNATRCGSDDPQDSSAGSHGGTGSGSGNGSAGGDTNNATSSTPEPETPTVTSPSNAPVPAPSSGATESERVIVTRAVGVVALVVALAL